MSNLDPSTTSLFMNLPSSSSLPLRTPSNLRGISNPKDYLYELQNDNFFSGDEYSEDLNNYLVQAINYYENFNVVPLRFSPPSQKPIVNNNPEINCFDGKQTKQPVNLGENYKRRRPCEEILESEVVEASRMEKPANAQILQENNGCVQNVEGMSVMRKKVKRESEEEPSCLVEMGYQLKKFRTIQDLNLPQYENRLLENVDEEPIIPWNEHMSEQIRGDFVIYSGSDKSIILESKKNEKNEKDCIKIFSGQGKQIAKTNDQNLKTVSVVKPKQKMTKALRGISSFMLTKRCQSVIRKYQLLL